jgi:hypothetical protein
MLYYPAHGMGLPNQVFNNPWSSELFGRGAKQGGTWNTFKIPFSKSVNLTAILPQQYDGNPVYWMTVKGVKGTSKIVLGKNSPLELPAGARLKLYAYDKLPMKPLEFLTLSNSQRSGAVIAVNLAVESGNLNFLEGCIRAHYNGGKDKVLIASGTEDYFMSAFYFDGGLFQFPSVGLTYTDYNKLFSAYKIHVEDPIFFRETGLKLTWRNGDTNDPATGQKCINDNGPPNGDPQNSTVTAYTWVYEW